MGAAVAERGCPWPGVAGSGLPVHPDGRCALLQEGLYRDVRAAAAGKRGAGRQTFITGNARSGSTLGQKQTCIGRTTKKKNPQHPFPNYHLLVGLYIFKLCVRGKSGNATYCFSDTLKA